MCKEFIYEKNDFFAAKYDKPTFWKNKVYTFYNTFDTHFTYILYTFYNTFYIDCIM